jgi:hypothetical protein
MKKIITTSIVAAVAGFVVNMVIGYLFIFIVPELEGQYENELIFRPWSDPLMSLYFMHPVYMAFMLAWVWTKVRSILPEKQSVAAFNFAIIYWLIATLPGIVISYSSFKISFAMSASWLIGAFFQTYVMSFLYSKMLK